MQFAKREMVDATHELRINVDAEVVAHGDERYGDVVGKQHVGPDVGYVPVHRDGAYIGRIKFSFVGGDVLAPVFEPAPRCGKGSPAEQLPPCLEDWCRANPGPSSYAIEVMYGLIADIVRGNAVVDNTITFNTPAEIPSGSGFSEFKDVGVRTFQAKYKIQGGPDE